MSDSEEDKNEVRVYQSTYTYKKKDGSTSTRVIQSKYIPTGNPRGKPRTPQSKVVAEGKTLSDKHANKVLKYIEKLRSKE